jgi:hypothetical protein
MAQFKWAIVSTEKKLNAMKNVNLNFGKRETANGKPRFAVRRKQNKRQS